MITVGAAAVAALIDHIGDGDTSSNAKHAKGSHDAFAALLDVSTGGAMPGADPQAEAAGAKDTDARRADGKGSESKTGKVAGSSKHGDPTIDGDLTALLEAPADAASMAAVVPGSDPAASAGKDSPDTVPPVVAILGLGAATDTTTPVPDPSRSVPTHGVGDLTPAHPRPVSKRAAPPARTTADDSPTVAPLAASASTESVESVAALTARPPDRPHTTAEGTATPAAIESVTAAAATASPPQEDPATSGKDSPTRIDQTLTIDPTRREAAATLTRPTASTTSLAAGSNSVVSAPAPTVGPVAATAHVRAQAAALPGVASQLLTVIAPVRPVPAGGHTVTIALQPEGLGTVRAAVTATNDQLLVRLTASSVDGASAVRASLPELHLALSGTHQEATVTLTGDSGTNWNGNPAASGDAGAEGRLNHQTSPMVTPSVRYTPSTSAPTVVPSSSTSSSGLDVRM